MNWLNKDILDEARETCVGRTYNQAAVILTEKYGEYITGEQLRSALRRSKRRVYDDRERSGFQKPAITKSRPVAFPRKRVDREIIFGAVGDSHLCSFYERNDILESLYDIYQERGVERVFHTGNYIDGEAPFNQHELYAHGIDGQCEYFIRNYPQRNGIQTLYIDGDDHENWYSHKFGIVVGRHLEDLARRSGRTDLIYLGSMENDVALIDGSERTVRVLHAGGGSSYALSHTSQKLIDTYEEYEKPDILLVGHYHKAHFLPNYRGVAVIQTGTTQEQTPFMRKKRLHADLGGWIITVGLDEEDSIVQLQAEFISYPARSWKRR